MNAYQTNYLVFLDVLGLSQYVFVDSLIVVEVYLLNMKHLLGFLDLLPEVFALVQHEEARTALLVFLNQQWINEVLDLNLLSAVVDLELIREFVETVDDMNF